MTVLVDIEERTRCLVEQGFTPALAQSVVLARSRENLPLTIWLVDNSSSMTTSDGRRLLETRSQKDVRVERCTRWEELQEAVKYHAQLAAVLHAPTKFVLLNDPSGPYACLPREMSIAERGKEYIEAELKIVLSSFSKISPEGITPLTLHLHRIHQSIQHLHERIVLVLATDGRPTDSHGYSSVAVDRAFENALRVIQSHAWVVIRLCTDDTGVLDYYRTLDENTELSLEVLDDFLDEAKEVHSYNPWLTYSLVLHRCREMGLSCHSLHRWLDWLDERTMTRSEILQVLGILGLVDWTSSPDSLEDPGEWTKFCMAVDREQKRLMVHRQEGTESCLQAYSPWNPVRKCVTPWVDVGRLRRHGSVPLRLSWGTVGVIVAVVAILAKILHFDDYIYR